MSESPFIHRGVVEGYYGRPYAHADRLWLLDRMAEWQMNTYVYAPKDDPLHRERWRDPYPAEARAEFESLVDHGQSREIRVGFAIAPGLSIAYGAEPDRVALLRKLETFAEIGARFFCLALDDVPSTLTDEGDRARFASLAAAHVELAHLVRDALPSDSTLWLVPTDYAGTAGSTYLETLGATLDPAIEVGWTGRSVVSPEIRTVEARARADSLGRRLLVWDNFPVNDGPMRNVLHLGPFTGRDPDLSRHVSGILLNPMELPHASAIALATAGRYLADPAAYDPEKAWRDAVDAMAGGDDAAALRLFASGHRFSALTPDDRDAELETSWREIREALSGEDRASARAATAKLSEQLDARVDAVERLRTGMNDPALATELVPWLLAHTTETRIMREAADLISVLVDDVPALQVALAFFRMEGRLTRIPPGSRTSYGPRRQVYPQLESLEDEGARFGDDPVLFLDRCLSDQLVRYAESLAMARLGGRSAGPSPG